MSDSWSGLKMVPVSVAAEILGCTPLTIRNLVRAGRLPVYKFSSRMHRYRVDDLEAFIQRHNSWSGEE